MTLSALSKFLRPQPTLALLAAMSLASPDPLCAQVRLWEDWVELEAPPPDEKSGRYLQDLAAGENSNGGLELFAIESEWNGATPVPGHLWHIFQTAPSGDWTQWRRFAELDLEGTRLTVARNEDGRLEVFMISTNQDVHHRWQATQGGWSGWATFQTPPGTSFVGDLEVGQNADGRLEVFVTGSDGTIWHRWQVVANGTWSGWAWLEGPPGTQSPTTDIAVARNPNGKLQVFLAAQNGNIWQRRRELTATNNWSDWTLFGSPLGNSEIPEIEIARDAGGPLEMFVTRDGNVWYRRQELSSISQPPPINAAIADPGPFIYLWGAWKRLKAPPGVAFGKQLPWIFTHRLLDSGENLDGRLELLVNGEDGSMWRASQIEPNGDWGIWNEITRPPSDDERIHRLFGPVVGRTTVGQLAVFAESTKCFSSANPITCGLPGSLWVATQCRPNGLPCVRIGRPTSER